MTEQEVKLKWQQLIIGSLFKDLFCCQEKDRGYSLFDQNSILIQRKKEERYLVKSEGRKEGKYTAETENRGKNSIVEKMAFIVRAPLSQSALQNRKEFSLSSRFGLSPVKEGGRWSCRKKDIHPQFYEDAKIYCNGEHVMTTGGTQKEYVVDVWSGNHPFYLGNRSALLVDADQVEKFRKKYGELSNLMQIPVLKYGEIILPKKKSAGKGKGKK